MVKKIKTAFRKPILLALSVVFAGTFLLAPAVAASPLSSPIKTFAVDADCKEETLTSENCGIIDYLVKAINILSALVGLVVITMIVVAGIQYSASGDDPQKVSLAKKRVYNALLALFIFIFMFAFLQWVVPGGIF